MSKQSRRTSSQMRRGPRGGLEVRLGPDRTAEIFEGPPLGPGVTRADNATILAALRSLDPERPWTEIRHDIRPMLPRHRPYPPGFGDPVRKMLPPGILVGFGIDIGPANALVGQPLLEMWGIGVDELADQALANTREIALACDPRLVVRQSVGDVDVAALQTRAGIAAALLLVPATLSRFFGSDAAFFIAPLRDLLLRLPVDVDRGDALWLANEFESMDPNCLHLGGFAWDGQVLRPEPIEGVVAFA